MKFILCVVLIIQYITFSSQQTKGYLDYEILFIVEGMLDKEIDLFCPMGAPINKNDRNDFLNYIQDILKPMVSIGNFKSFLPGLISDKVQVTSIMSSAIEKIFPKVKELDKDMCKNTFNLLVRWNDVIEALISCAFKMRLAGKDDTEPDLKIEELKKDEITQRRPKAETDVSGQESHLTIISQTRSKLKTNISKSEKSKETKISSEGGSNRKLKNERVDEKNRKTKDAHKAKPKHQEEENDSETKTQLNLGPLTDEDRLKVQKYNSEKLGHRVVPLHKLLLRASTDNPEGEIAMYVKPEIDDDTKTLLINVEELKNFFASRKVKNPDKILSRLIKPDDMEAMRSDYVSLILNPIKTRLAQLENDKEFMQLLKDTNKELTDYLNLTKNPDIRLKIEAKKKELKESNGGKLVNDLTEELTSRVNTEMRAAISEGLEEGFGNDNDYQAELMKRIHLKVEEKITHIAQKPVDDEFIKYKEIIKTSLNDFGKVLRKVLIKPLNLAAQMTYIEKKINQSNT
jgi:hypothetical protein